MLSNNSIEAINMYLTSVDSQYRLGNSTEHSHRAFLQTLLSNLYPQFSITNEPRHIDCGAPDFVVQRSHTPIGYIETKDIGKGLGEVERSEQLKRYLAALDNFVLTDYLEFRFFIRGEKIKTVRIAETDPMKNRVTPLSENYQEFSDLLDTFFSYSGITIRTAPQLARKMAVKARELAFVVKNVLEGPNAEATTLFGQYQAFKSMLIDDLTEQSFADMFAQTIAYGLFAARLNDNTPDSFSREEARGLIPKTNPFLRNLFDNISGINIDDQIVWIVDDLADLFSRSDLSAMFKRQEKDPFIHFYETFLGEYSPSLKKAAGVFYTPNQVVSFIVKSIDDVLRQRFGYPLGLASTDKIDITVEEKSPKRKTPVVVDKQVHKIQLLDPACGTGTFIVEAIKAIHHYFEGQEGIWSNYVDEELISRINGFELLMAPYTVSHIKTELLLKQLGYTQTETRQNQRLNIYLTNTLEKAHEDTTTLFSTWLADESVAASRVKKNAPVFVVLGNPPYQAASTNNGSWAQDLIAEYKKEPDSKQQLNEKNSKWLNDDYVKFIRYGEFLIDRTGEGVLAYINPHGWLDNLCFRGMRWHLLKTFDEIYVINLHGNANKGERCPDGSRDDNVFDIRQGVCINIFVKKPGLKNGDLARVYYKDVWGTRASKYSWLETSALSTIEWDLLEPVAPMYYLVKRDTSFEDEYNSGFSIQDLFIHYSMGITSGNDAATYCDSEKEANSRIEQLLSDGMIQGAQEYKGWTFKDAVSDLKSGRVITSFCFRPFDTKYSAYTGRSKGWMTRPREDVMPHLLKSNVALATTRLVQKGDYHHAFVADGPVDKGILSGKDNAYVFPLWLYSNSLGGLKREPNFRSGICRAIGERMGLEYVSDSSLDLDRSKQFGPGNLFDYIYAFLWDSNYLGRFGNLLKEDFARIPYPASADAFWQLSDLGKALRLIHTMDPTTLLSLNTSFPVSGDNVVEKAVYEDGKVFINDTQYIGNVPRLAWEKYIGNYQPAQKWLKDRKGQKLSFSELVNYQKLIAAMLSANEIEKKIADYTVDLFGGE